MPATVVDRGTTSIVGDNLPLRICWSEVVFASGQAIEDLEGRQLYIRRAYRRGPLWLLAC
jgi:hypothetical protein